MRLATPADMPLVADIITHTFEHNPGVNWLLRKRGDRRKHVQKLAQYAFVRAQIRSGVYISENEKGVAICYPMHQQLFSWREIWYQLRFAFGAMPIRRIPEVLKREAYRKSIRPQDTPYLYFWFFGVLPQGGRAAWELGKGLLAEAQKLGLPIYLETAVLRNQRIYERMGCETYHYWEVPEKGIQFWFMRWIPNQGLQASQ